MAQLIPDDTLIFFKDDDELTEIYRCTYEEALKAVKEAQKKMKSWMGM